MSRPPIQQWAGHYTGNMGFSVVPLLPRTKEPVIQDWPKKTFGPDDFRADANLGLHGNDQLRILDDDFETPAVGCMEHFMPATGAVYGKASTPRAKHLYICPELTETFTLKDIDNRKHLLQIRAGSGLQDMAPPSVHPNGEKLVWDGLLVTPATVDANSLLAGVRYAYTARLIAKYWPEHGLHDLRLAFAHFLLDGIGMPEEHVIEVLEWACRLGGSDPNGIKDVRTAVRSTKQRIATDQPATGAPTIAKLLPDVGRQLVAALRKAWQKDDPLVDAIEELNERFGIVSVANKVVVMETWLDGGVKELWPFPEFNRLLIKEKVQVGDKVKPLAPLWLQHRDGRRHDRLVYVMPGSTEQLRDGDYNGWLGFTVKPVAGDWSKNRAHIRDVICKGDDQCFVWVLNWCAALVQAPGKHAFAAIVLRGGEGTGKGHFAHQMLGALFHKQQYLHIIGAEALTGRFNEHLSGKVLIFADESTWGGDPRAADRLKGMVTENTVNIERKFLPLIEEPSALHIIMASNNEWPVSIPIDDRRYMVLDVADTQRQNDAYFGPLRRELADGGLAAMLHDLLNYPIDDHALRHPIITDGKRDVMAHSLKPIQRWWFEKLSAGAIGTGDEWPTEIMKAEVHQDYLQFLDQHHRAERARRATETELGTFLQPYGYTKRASVDGKRELFLALKPLAECRGIWVKACNWSDAYTWGEGPFDLVG